MGACATKPKVKTSDGTGKEAPAPVPQPVKDEPAGTGAAVGVVVPDDHEGKEKKEVVVVSEEVDDEKKKVLQGDEDHHHGGGADDDQIKEVVDDEQASKRRSLSHLFKENEDGKDVTEKNEETPSDEGAIVKKLEPLPSESEYLTADESESTKIQKPAPEVKDSETVVEETIPAAIEVNNSSNAPEEKTKTEEVIEAAPADSETHDDKVTTLLQKYRGETELENQNIEAAPASETTHDDKVKVILDKFREGEEEKTTVDVKENNQENVKV